jgi:hypothetical protein
MNYIPDEWRAEVPLICSAIERIEPLSTLDDAYEAGIPELLADISKSCEHQRIVRRVARQWFEEPKWFESMNSVPGNIVLGQARCGNVLAIAFSLGFNRTRPRVSIPIDTLMTALSPHGLKVNVSPLCGSTDFELPDPTLRVLAREEKTCAQHESIGLRCGTVFDYADTDSMVLKVELINRTPLRFHFDAIDGHYLGASLSGPADSQLLAFITSLRTTGTPDMAQVLMGYAIHPSHWVRWETVKTIAELDTDLALQAIRGMVDDPHPEIRHAAAKTLEGA